MKSIQINSRKEALNFVFQNSPCISIRFDRRRKEVKQVLYFVSFEETKEIEAKKMKRYGNKEPYLDMPIKKLIWTIKSFARKDNYRKVLIQGNNGFYWCNPVYGLRDYNRSFAGKLTDKNARKVSLINSLIDKWVDCLPTYAENLKV
jgi:hypothetical protein